MNQQISQAKESSNAQASDPDCRCDNCGFTCAASKLNTARHLTERLDYPIDDPRCIVPDGECPECGALSYEVEAQDARRATGAKGLA